MWLLLIAISTVLYAAVVLLDRYVMGYRLAEPAAYLAIGSVAGLAVSGAIILSNLSDFPLDTEALVGGVGIGVLFGIFAYLYLETLREASPVTTVAYMQILPVITTVGAIYVVGEDVPQSGFTAILLVIGGLTCISIIDWRAPSIAAYRMLPAVAVLALAYIFQKLLLASYSPLELLALNRFGNLLVVAPLAGIEWMRHHRRSCAANEGRITKTGWVAALLGEGGSIGAMYLALLAYNQGPFAETSTIAATLPVVVLIGAAVLSKRGRREFWRVPELSSRGATILALLGATAMVTAIFVLFAANGSGK